MSENIFIAFTDLLEENKQLKTKLEYVSRDRDALKAEVTKLILRVKELEAEIERKKTK